MFGYKNVMQVPILQALERTPTALWQAEFLPKFRLRALTAQQKKDAYEFVRRYKAAHNGEYPDPLRLSSDLPARGSSTSTYSRRPAASIPRNCARQRSRSTCPVARACSTGV